jgi:hypothetical protein
VCAGTGGNPHGLAMLGGTLAIGLLTAIEWSVLSMAGSSGAWRALVAGALVVAAATVAGALALSRLAPVVARRRENIVLVAQGR